MKFKSSFIACILLLAFVTISSAQPPTYEMQNKSSFKFSYLRVKFDERASFWAGYIDLGIASSINLKYIVELPFDHYGYSDYYDYYPYDTEFSDDAFGNIYIGVEGSKAQSGAFYEAGIRLPTASDKGWSPLLGSVTDIGRFDAFAHDITVVKGELGYRSEKESGIMTLLKFGPSLWLNGNKDANDDGSELFVNYSAHLWYYGPNTDYGIGLTGTGILTEDHILFNNKFINRFEFGMGFRTGQFRPSFELFLPLSEDLEVINYTLGLNVTAYFK